VQLDNPPKGDAKRRMALRCPLCKAQYQRVLYSIVSDSEYKTRDFSKQLERIRSESAREHSNQSSSSSSLRPFFRDEFEWGVGRRHGDGSRPRRQRHARTGIVRVGREEYDVDIPLYQRNRLYQSVRRHERALEILGGAEEEGGRESRISRGYTPLELPFANAQSLVPWLQVELQAIAETRDPDPVLTEYVLSILESDQPMTRSEVYMKLRPFFHLDRVISVFLTRLHAKQRACHPLVSAAQEWRRRSLSLRARGSRNDANETEGKESSRVAVRVTSSPSSSPGEAKQRRAFDQNIYDRDSGRGRSRGPRKRSVPMYVVVAGRYGCHSAMNGVYKWAMMQGERPAYVRDGQGETRGGEEWKWILRYYEPKKQWKLDFYPTVRDTDNCFAYLVSDAFNPADARGTWGVWEARDETIGERAAWVLDPRLWVSRIQGGPERNVEFEGPESKSAASSVRPSRDSRALSKLSKKVSARERGSGHEDGVRRRSRNRSRKRPRSRRQEDSRSSRLKFANAQTSRLRGHESSKARSSISRATVSTSVADSVQGNRHRIETRAEVSNGTGSRDNMLRLASREDGAKASKVMCRRTESIGPIVSRASGDASGSDNREKNKAAERARRELREVEEEIARTRVLLRKMKRKASRDTL